MKYLAFLSILLFTACESKECCSFPDELNYSFDIRSCQTDLFSEAVDENGDLETRQSTMISWLEDNDVNVLTLELKLQHLENVCEACNICPTGDRYFFTSYDDLSEPKIESLKLLNLEKWD